MKLKISINETPPTCCAVSRDTPQPAPTGFNLRNPVSSKSTVDSDMSLVPGGVFSMGTDYEGAFSSDGEGPVRKVYVDPFYIDKIAVTNTKFARFTRETGYRTEAEKFGWSFVFYLFIAERAGISSLQSPSGTPWWKRIDGSSWRHPEGPSSNIKDRMNHPVVHMSWNDAIEYCNWSGKRLPTEAEWEFAARGGLEKKIFPWGDELTPKGIHRCNIWQGTFPNYNSEEDGFAGTAPAKQYEPNDYGLYNVAGNVWEWQSDWFSSTFHSRGSLTEPDHNPQGPIRGTTKTIKGGSYLCHDSYCNRYRVAARSANTPDSSTGNLGFRCVFDA